jgi:uncharacterized protein YndB with AHSA1/START domain
MPYSCSASIVVRASREAVWKAVTDPQLVKRYFFGTDLVTDWKVGSPVLFRGEWEGKTYEDRGTVLAFDPPRALSFNYWSAFSGEADTEERRQIIRYELADVPEGVRVTVEQSNADTQARADHSAENWQKVLAGLKEVVEGSSSAA